MSSVPAANYAISRDQKETILRFYSTIQPLLQEVDGHLDEIAFTTLPNCTTTSSLTLLSANTFERPQQQTNLPSNHHSDEHSAPQVPNVALMDKCNMPQNRTCFTFNSSSDNAPSTTPKSNDSTSNHNCTTLAPTSSNGPHNLSNNPCDSPRRDSSGLAIIPPATPLFFPRSPTLPSLRLPSSNNSNIMLSTVRIGFARRHEALDYLRTNEALLRSRFNALSILKQIVSIAITRIHSILTTKIDHLRSLVKRNATLIESYRNLLSDTEAHNYQIAKRLHESNDKRTYYEHKISSFDWDSRHHFFLAAFSHYSGRFVRPHLLHDAINAIPSHLRLAALSHSQVLSIVRLETMVALAAQSIANDHEFIEVIEGYNSKLSLFIEYYVSLHNHLLSTSIETVTDVLSTISDSQLLLCPPNKYYHYILQTVLSRLIPTDPIQAQVQAITSPQIVTSLFSNTDPTKQQVNSRINRHCDNNNNNDNDNTDLFHADLFDNPDQIQPSNTLQNAPPPVNQTHTPTDDSSTMNQYTLEHRKLSLIAAKLLVQAPQLRLCHPHSLPFYSLISPAQQALVYLKHALNAPCVSFSCCISGEIKSHMGSYYRAQHQYNQRQQQQQQQQQQLQLQQTQSSLTLMPTMSASYVSPTPSGPCTAVILAGNPTSLGDQHNFSPTLLQTSNQLQPLLSLYSAPPTPTVLPPPTIIISAQPQQLLSHGITQHQERSHLQLPVRNLSTPPTVPLVPQSTQPELPQNQPLTMAVMQTIPPPRTRSLTLVQSALLPGSSGHHPHSHPPAPDQPRRLLYPYTDNIDYSNLLHIIQNNNPTETNQQIFFRAHGIDLFQRDWDLQRYQQLLAQFKTCLIANRRRNSITGNLAILSPSSPSPHPSAASALPFLPSPQSTQKNASINHNTDIDSNGPILLPLATPTPQTSGPNKNPSDSSVAEFTNQHPKDPNSPDTTSIVTNRTIITQNGQNDKFSHSSPVNHVPPPQSPLTPHHSRQSMSPLPTINNTLSGLHRQLAPLAGSYGENMNKSPLPPQEAIDIALRERQHKTTMHKLRNQFLTTFNKELQLVHRGAPSSRHHPHSLNRKLSDHSQLIAMTLVPSTLSTSSEQNQRHQQQYKEHDDAPLHQNWPKIQWSEEVLQSFLDTQPKVCCSIQHNLRERIYKQKELLGIAHAVLGSKNSPNQQQQHQHQQQQNDIDQQHTYPGHTAMYNPFHTPSVPKSNLFNAITSENSSETSDQPLQSEGEGEFVHVDFYSDFSQNKAALAASPLPQDYAHPLNINMLELPDQISKVTSSVTAPWDQSHQSLIPKNQNFSQTNSQTLDPHRPPRSQINADRIDNITSVNSSDQHFHDNLDPFSASPLAPWQIVAPPAPMATHHISQPPCIDHGSARQGGILHPNSQNSRPIKIFNPLDSVPNELLHMQCIALPPAILAVGLRPFKLHPYYVSGIAGLLDEQRKTMLKQQSEEKGKENRFLLNSSLADRTQTHSSVNRLSTQRTNDCPGREQLSVLNRNNHNPDNNNADNNSINNTATTTRVTQSGHVYPQSGVINPFKQHCAGHSFNAGPINPINQLGLFNEIFPKQPSITVTPTIQPTALYKPSSRSGNNIVIDVPIVRCDYQLANTKLDDQNNGCNLMTNQDLPAHLANIQPNQNHPMAPTGATTILTYYPVPPTSPILKNPPLTTSSPTTTQITPAQSKPSHQTLLLQYNHVTAAISQLEHTLLCNAPISSLAFVSPDTPDTMIDSLASTQSSLTADDLLSAAKEYDDALHPTPHPTTFDLDDDPDVAEGDLPFNFLHHLPIAPTSPSALPLPPLPNHFDKSAPNNDYVHGESHPVPIQHAHSQASHWRANGGDLDDTTHSLPITPSSHHSPASYVPQLTSAHKYHHYDDFNNFSLDEMATNQGPDSLGSNSNSNSPEQPSSPLQTVFVNQIWEALSPEQKLAFETQNNRHNLPLFLPQSPNPVQYHTSRPSTLSRPSPDGGSDGTKLPLRPRPRQRRALFIQTHSEALNLDPPLVTTGSCLTHGAGVGLKSGINHSTNGPFENLPSSVADSCAETYLSPPISTTPAPQLPQQCSCHKHKPTPTLLDQQQPIASIDEITFFNVSGHPIMKTLMQLRSEIQEQIKDAETGLSGLSDVNIIANNTKDLNVSDHHVVFGQQVQPQPPQFSPPPTPHHQNCSKTSSRPLVTPTITLPPTPTHHCRMPLQQPIQFLPTLAPFTTPRNNADNIKETISYLLQSVLFQDEASAMQQFVLSALSTLSNSTHAPSPPLGSAVFDASTSFFIGSDHGNNNPFPNSTSKLTEQQIDPTRPIPSPFTPNVSTLHEFRDLSQQQQDPHRVRGFCELLFSPRSSQSAIDLLLILSNQCTKQTDMCWAQLERVILQREQLLGAVEDLQQTGCVHILHPNSQIPIPPPTPTPSRCQ